MQALAYLQDLSKRSVETGDLSRTFGWTAEQERKLLSRLARKGLIARIRRGLYLVPARLPLGGKWSPGEFLALTTLIGDQGGSYQISGLSTFHRYGWAEQVPNRVYAYNNRISGDREIGSVALTLIKVTDSRLGATEVVRTPDGLDVVYASRARSLMDAVYDWSRFNTLPQAYGWIRRELLADEALAADLVQVTLRYGNQGTLRRIGALLEMTGVSNHLLRKLQRAIHASTSFIPWIPARSKRGTTSKRWGVVVNGEA